MNLNEIYSVYFVGAGGIGMSALIRYFLSQGKIVAGYDRTATPLTQKLIEAPAGSNHSRIQSTPPHFQGKTP